MRSKGAARSTTPTQSEGGKSLFTGGYLMLLLSKRAARRSNLTQTKERRQRKEIYSIYSKKGSESFRAAAEKNFDESEKRSKASAGGSKA